MDIRAEHPATPAALRELIDRYAPAADAPLPAAGRTLERWRLLARVAHTHGTVAIKLFESHLDALAILAELAGARPAASTQWAVWAAEPPFATVDARPGPDIGADTLDALRRDAGLAASQTGPMRAMRTVPVRLSGRKAWCSGAREVSHALMTCRDDAGARRLAIVPIAPGMGAIATDEGWNAVGMARTYSGDVLFHDTPALLLGGADAYLDRPGFWHGGAGIAACWYGAVLPFADALRASLARRADPHVAAHLGSIDGQLHAAAALLRETAAWIDAHPGEDAMAHALRARTVIEAAVAHTLQHAGNALGAGPLCRDARLAALYADLPVFVRQSHAERDLAALGTHIAADRNTEWAL
ncbi:MULTISPECIES: acyl-CoA dehydrogenase [unclassified Cupriavidus]|uniref:acyl-CoA dehydrogenase n=1 Tax=unclassified Cupriavidus TaxID=2640874 RepID=UPI00313C8EA8